MASIYDRAGAALKAAEAKAVQEGFEPAVVKAKGTYAYALVMACGDKDREHRAWLLFQRRLKAAAKPPVAPLDPMRSAPSEQNTKQSVAGRMLAAGQMAARRASCLG